MNNGAEHWQWPGSCVSLTSKGVSQGHTELGEASYGNSTILCLVIGRKLSHILLGRWECDLTDTLAPSHWGLQNLIYFRSGVAIISSLNNF